MTGVYQIKNKVNGKTYIGSSINIEERFINHKRNLIRGTHKNSKLQNAYNKYGSKKFIFEIIEICFKETLHEREQEWIDSTQYNMGLFGVGYNINCKADRVNFTPEVKLKMKINHKGSTGISCSEDKKRKISIANKGNKYAEGNTNTLGMHHSKEAKLKMSESAKASWTPERRAAMGKRMKGNKSNTGRKVSQETKNKMSISARNMSQETKNKMSISAKLAWGKRNAFV